MRMAASSTLFGIVLAVSMFGAGIAAEKLTNVYVTNFPLDKQGNLRISPQNITLITNPTVTTLTVIPLNTTIRDALTMFTPFWNHTWFDSSFGRNITEYMYRLTLNISEWKSVVAYASGPVLYHKGDLHVGHRTPFAMSFLANFGIQDIPENSQGNIMYGPNAFSFSLGFDYNSATNTSKIWWQSVAYPEYPDSRVQISGSQLHIHLYYFAYASEEILLNDNRIGLSLYLQG